MTEEQRFTDYLDTDTTFWGNLYRRKQVKTFKEARRVVEEFCRESKAERLDANEPVKPRSVDYLEITRGSVAR